MSTTGFYLWTVVNTPRYGNKADGNIAKSS